MSTTFSTTTLPRGSTQIGSYFFPPTSNSRPTSIENEFESLKTEVNILKLQQEEWKQTYALKQEQLEANLFDSNNEIIELKQKNSELSTQLKKIQEEMDDFMCLI